MIVKIQAIGIAGSNLVSFSSLPHVPMNKVCCIGKIIALTPIVPRGFNVLLPGTVYDLRITVSATGTTPGYKAEQLSSWWSRFWIECRFLIHNRHSRVHWRAPLFLGFCRHPVPTTLLLEDGTNIIRTRRRSRGTARYQQTKQEDRQQPMLFFQKHLSSVVLETECRLSEFRQIKKP